MWPKRCHRPMMRNPEPTAPEFVEFWLCSGGEEVEFDEESLSVVC